MLRFFPFIFTTAFNTGQDVGVIMTELEKVYAETQDILLLKESLVIQNLKAICFVFLLMLFMNVLYFRPFVRLQALF